MTASSSSSSSFLLGSKCKKGLSWNNLTWCYDNVLVKIYTTTSPRILALANQHEIGMEGVQPRNQIVAQFFFSLITISCMSFFDGRAYDLYESAIIWGNSIVEGAFHVVVIDLANFVDDACALVQQITPFFWNKNIALGLGLLGRVNTNKSSPKMEPDKIASSSSSPFRVYKQKQR